MQKLLARLGLGRGPAMSETVEDILKATNDALKRGEEILAAYRRTQAAPGPANQSPHTNNPAG
jgi:hypothetical protein